MTASPNIRRNRLRPLLIQESWVLATLLLAALPSLLYLPLWVAVIALLGGGLHYAGQWRKGWHGKGVNALLLGATAAGIWLSFDSWFSGDAVLSFFIAVVFLKWGESSTRRDNLLLIFAAVILAAVGALYWETLLSLLHMFVVVLALTASLVVINAGASAPGWYPVIRRSGGLFLLGLPLMALLFLTFPRIPGPLWDIGLAFGLPVKALMERGKGDFGKMKVLQPGGIHRGSQENGNVLVAEFQGAVPFTGRLYWRGPVFWDYDGENWFLPESWDNRARLLRRAIRSKQKLEQELRWKRQPVRYSLRVMPNGGRWLYGLDVPAAPAPESFISDEYQLLSIRKIDDHEPKLEMFSYLDYGVGSELTDEQHKRGLSWPQKSNPRLRALGQELREKYLESEEILRQGYILISSGGYDYDPAHLVAPGPNTLDRFFFDEKQGGAEYLAGSFTLLMRAAGIPARLVSGFRGGTVVALTNFVIVKQSNAHAWVEVWLDDKGWSRAEIKDLVVTPDKPKKHIETIKPEESVQQVLARKNKVPVESVPEINLETRGLSAPAQNNKPDAEWSLPAWADLFGSLQKWIIDYDPDRQEELLQGAGMDNSNWLDLMAAAMAGLCLLVGLFLSVAWWRGRVSVDPVSRAWRQFCGQLAKLGLERKAYECPRDYLNRLRRKYPEYAAGAGDITERYITIRYGNEKSPEAVMLLQRQVKRFVSMI